MLNNSTISAESEWPKKRKRPGFRTDPLEDERKKVTIVQNISVSVSIQTRRAVGVSLRVVSGR